MMREAESHTIKADWFCSYWMPANGVGPSLKQGEERF